MPVPVVSYAYKAAGEERLAIIRQYAGQSILDVGCGNGCYTKALAGDHDVRGVDMGTYDAWKERPDLFCEGDAASLPFANESFDTVLCLEALEHMPDPRKVLLELKRVCRKNIILTVPNCDVTEGMEISRLTYYHWVDRTHVNFFDLESLSKLVSECGFKPVRQSHVGEISLIPLVNEALGLRGVHGLVIRRVLRLLQKRRYYISCLMVADKESGR